MNPYPYLDEQLDRIFSFCVPDGARVLVVSSVFRAALDHARFSQVVYWSDGAFAEPPAGRPANAVFPSAAGRPLQELGLFDAVLVFDRLVFLDDIQGFFSSLRALCRPRTRVVFNYYSLVWHPFLRRRFSGRDFPNWITAADVRNFLSLGGFECVRYSSHVVFPFRLGAFSRLLNRFVAPLPLVNRIFCAAHVALARPLFPAAAPRRERPVSIVVPARNEAGNIRPLVSRLPRLGARCEVIFVEGNSTDRTWEEILTVCRDHPGLNLKALRQPGRGKGDAVRFGFSLAEGDVLMILDADLSVAPEDLPKFYDALLSGYGEFINGCRLVYPMEKQAMRFLNLLANKFFGYCFSWLLGQRYRDTLCGTKVLWREDYRAIAAGRSVFGDFDPFGDFDLIFGAARLGLKTVEVPVRYHERTYGTTNIRRFYHGWLLLRMCAFAAARLKFR